MQALEFSGRDQPTVKIRGMGRPRPYGVGAIVALGFLAICDKKDCGWVQQEKTGVEAQAALIGHQRERHG